MQRTLINICGFLAILFLISCGSTNLPNEAGPGGTVVGNPRVGEGTIAKNEFNECIATRIVFTSLQDSSVTFSATPDQFCNFEVSLAPGHAYKMVLFKGDRRVATVTFDLDSQSGNQPYFYVSEGSNPLNFGEISLSATPGEATASLSPARQNDRDGDGINDYNDPDDDNDGILDIDEVDCDSDGIPDDFQAGADQCSDDETTSTTREEITEETTPAVVRTASDPDGDGFFDLEDNCPKIANPDQSDLDADGTGDVCDDSDRDSVADAFDNCPFHSNSNQKDSDRDGIGDVCEDTDGDTVPDHLDNCPNIHNPGQKDSNRDGIGDECENTEGTTPSTSIETSIDCLEDRVSSLSEDCRDTDEDGIADAFDNCPVNKNANQLDTDEDGMGDVCDIATNRLASGDLHNCMIKIDGTVKCWGYNNHGQLDIPLAHFNSSFSSITSSTSPRRDYSCGLLKEKPEIGSNLKCWGDVPHSLLVADLGYNEFSQVSASRDHICALLKGTPSTGSNLKCSNTRIEEITGYNDKLEPEIEIKIVGPNPSDLANLQFIKVVTNNDNTCALAASAPRDRTNLICWGESGYSDTIRESFDGFPPQFTDLTAGFGHFCALIDPRYLSAGESNLNCWGSPASIPHIEDYTGQLFKKVEAGPGNIICALLAEKPSTGSNLKCWGPEEVLYPSTEDLRDTQFSEVSVGKDHVCALSLKEKNSQQVKIQCWGGKYEIARNKNLRNLQFKKISAGFHQICSILKNSPSSQSNLMCWQSKESYHKNRIPKEKNLTDGAQYQEVFIEEYYTCATLKYYSVGKTNLKCWGSSETLPNEILESTLHIKSFSSYQNYFYCALLLDKPEDESNLKCWGSSEHYTDYFPSQEELGDLEFQQLDLKDYGHTCALLKNTPATGSNLKCWGDETSLYQYYPFDSDLEETQFFDLSVGSAGTCALRNPKFVSPGENNISCWFGYRSVPYEIRSSSLIFKKIDFTNDHYCALIDDISLGKNEGNVLCWGDNEFGQARVPEEFANKKFSTISTGEDFTCGLLENPEPDQSNLVCWGLGDGRLLEAPE